MNITAKEFKSYFDHLYQKVLEQDFIIDKTGTKLVELLAINVDLTINEDIDGYIDFESRQSPKKYILQEFDWYNSHELKTTKMSNIKVWNECSDINKEINSNYGNLVFSRNNFSQFSNVVKTLTNHKESRQGLIIYTRPSIHYEWDSFEASDFICTNYQHFLIRHNKLYCITNMRSQDVIYGLFSDIPWFFTVYKKMLAELRKTYYELEYGSMIMSYNSFHCYERHFDILGKISSEKCELITV